VAICEAHGVRLTPLRRMVYELMLALDGPIRAYDLAAMLASHLGRPVAPPTAYRALDFLIAQGLVNRIESLQAYVVSSLPGNGSGHAMLVCSRCGAVAEMRLPEWGGEMIRQIERTGFVVLGRAVEIQGICPDCDLAAASVPDREAGA